MKKNALIENLPAVLPKFETETSLLDAQNDQSVINKVPEFLANEIVNIPGKYFTLSERQLKTACEPNELDARLRLTFWDEYNRVVGTPYPMIINNITRGVCFKEYFFREIVPNKKRLAYICVPPQDYVIAMREMLDLGLDQLREILTMPLVTKKVRKVYNVVTKQKEDIVSEEVNTNLIAKKIDIVKMLDARVKGAIAQKLDINQKNLNIAATTKVDPFESLSPEQIMALPSGGNEKVIDVGSVTGEETPGATPSPGAKA